MLVTYDTSRNNEQLVMKPSVKLEGYVSEEKSWTQRQSQLTVTAKTGYPLL